MEGITAIMAAEGKVERSKTMILVKNIPHQTKLEELRDMFSKFGSVSRVHDTQHDTRSNTYS
jgi:RNA recognition motif-containing protein